MQETKLADEDAPVMPFQLAGYELLHHGEGRWNGVAIASRVGIADVGHQLRGRPGAGQPARRDRGREEDFDPSDEARMVSAVCGGIRVVCLYAPNGRVVGSPFYEGKLRWFERLRALARRGLRHRRSPWSSAATSTSPRPTTMSGIPSRRTAARTCRQPERDALRRLATGAWLTRTGAHEPDARAVLAGGTTGRGCSTGTWACASTCST